MEFTRTHNTKKHLNHIQDASFFDNGPSLVRTGSRNCDFQVVPNNDVVFDSNWRQEDDIFTDPSQGVGESCYKTKLSVLTNIHGLTAQLNFNDVFDSIWSKEDEIPSTSSQGSCDDEPCSTSKAPLQDHYNLSIQPATVNTIQLTTCTTRKDSDSDSLDVYLKPCVITPTKLEDLYSTLENHDNVFQFPPKSSQQLSDQSSCLRTLIQNNEFNNIGYTIEQNNTNDDSSHCHDNATTGQVFDCRRTSLDSLVQNNTQQLTAQLNAQENMDFFIHGFVKKEEYTNIIKTVTSPQEGEYYQLSHRTLSSDYKSTNVDDTNLTDSNQNSLYPQTEPAFHLQQNHTHAHWSLNTPTDRNTMFVTSPVESRDLKAFHNDTEKQRRDQMKVRFEKLRKVIPKIEKFPKASKIVILRKAKECILHLEKEENRLEALKKTLKIKNKQLLEKLQSILK